VKKTLKKLFHLFTIGVFCLISINILQIRKGLDLSDESFYIISADPADSYDSWGWPFGWITSVVYRISDFDIVQFRAAGILILITSAYYFSWNASQVMYSNVKKNHKLFTKSIVLTTIGCASSLLVYTGFIRTPGYNWLNLASILFSLGTFIRITYNHERPNKKANLFLLSLGLFVSFHAKPTTPIFLLSAFSIIWYKRSNRSELVAYLTQVFFSLIVLASISVALKIWPIDFAQNFYEILTKPTLTWRSTLPFAALQILILPGYVIYFLIKNLNFQTLMVIALSSVFLTILKIRYKDSRFFKFATLSAMSIFVFSFVGVEVKNNSIDIKHLNMVDRAFLPLALLCLWLVIAMLYRNKLKLNDAFTTEFTQLNLLFLVALLAFGFGSATALLGKMSGASIFIVFLIYNTIRNLHLKAHEDFFVSFWFICMVISLYAITYFSSLSLPYRINTMSQQKEVCIVDEKKLSIFLDLETCSELKNISATLSENDFDENSYLLNISDPWRPGLNLLLGLRLPPGILLTIPEYKNSNEVLKDNLIKVNAISSVRNNWLMLPSSKNGANPAYSELIILLEEITGIAFKDSFKLVFTNSSIEIWKPSK
jgi:hypothetical protein